MQMERQLTKAAKTPAEVINLPVHFSSARRLTFLNRLFIYQRERFPLFGHAPLIFAFSFSAVSYSSLLRGQMNLPDFLAVAVAFVSSLIFFLQLRIADEFKDFEEDSRYRPYRPVPRGVIKLRELGIIGFLGATLQMSLAIWLRPALVILLVAAWAYLALMSVEFFARDWLKARPFTYMWTHMLIMPLVDLYATSCDWLAKGESQPRGLIWFLAASFSNGVVIEIGRKIRAPQDEETGVQTYTALWGRKRAVASWLIALAVTALFALLAAREINYLLPVYIILELLFVAASFVSVRFITRPTTRQAKAFELVSAAWTLALYLSLGAAPLFRNQQGI
jgi:4-hydroxybenzoate polyprenyltransferase